MAKQPVPSDKRPVRGEPIVHKVLAATMEEVALTGYDGLTLERVAARAGVNRTTIYRRWATKKELVEATMRHAAAHVAFDWDHGNLRDDLAELLKRARETFFTPGMLGMHRLMMEAYKEPSLCEVARVSRQEKTAQVMAMLVRAEKRGELHPDLDKVLFLDGIFGTLFVKVVFQNEPLTPQLGKRLLEHLMRIVSGHSVKKAPPSRPRTSVPRAKRKAGAGRAG